MRGHYAKGEQRRGEILEATLRILAEDGYKQTSLNAIARDLNTTTSTLVHYFGTREGLLEAVVNRWDSAETVPAAEHALEQWITTVKHNTTIPGIVRLYSSFAAESAPTDHPSHRFFQERFERIRAQVTSGLRYKQDTGRMSPELDSEQTAQDLIALSDGLQLQWLFNPNVEMAASLTRAIEQFRATGAQSVLDTPALIPLRKAR